MHQEYFHVSCEAAAAIAAQRKGKRRVIAVGTTTVRVLETIAGSGSGVKEVSDATALFIRPGFRFRCVDALITNFHLPRSTLLAMVGAFLEQKTGAGESEPARHPGGLAQLMALYQLAIRERYRFYSFGDAMLIE